MAAVRISYRDADKHDDVVTVGAFAQIAAKRRFGVPATKEGDPEAGLFGCYVEIHGAQAAASLSESAWDQWLMSIDDFAIDEDPTPATTSSEPSPDSPPTSE